MRTRVIRAATLWLLVPASPALLDLAAQAPARAGVIVNDTAPAAAETTTPLPLVSSFDDGTFGGWTADGSKTGGFGVASDGTPVAGAFAAFGAMRVNAHSGGQAAYALVSGVRDEALTLSRTVDLQPGIYEVGYYLGTDAPNKMPDLGPFSSLGNLVSVNGTSIALANTATAIPNGGTPDNFALYRAFFGTEGGPTKIDLRITGSGFARALVSIDDVYIRRLDPAGQTAIPEPGTLALFGLAALGLAAAKIRRRAR